MCDERCPKCGYPVDDGDCVNCDYRREGTMVDGKWLADQARPIAFDEMNATLERPAGMSEEECGELPVFRDGQKCVSCWRLPPAQLEEVARTGVVWVGVCAGWSQPPIFVSGTRPFVEV